MVFLQIDLVVLHINRVLRESYEKGANKGKTLLIRELVSLRRPQGPNGRRRYRSSWWGRSPREDAEAGSCGCSSEQCQGMAASGEVGTPARRGLAAGAALSSHGPAETASVATANDEYHMLGSCYYKISYIATAYERINSFLSLKLDIYARAHFLKASTWAKNVLKLKYPPTMSSFFAFHHLITLFHPELSFRFSFPSPRQ